MGYDEKRRLIPKFTPALRLEPLYRSEDFNALDGPHGEVRIYGSDLSSSTARDPLVPVISPVAPEESAGSSVNSVGEIIVHERSEP